MKQLSMPIDKVHLNKCNYYHIDSVRAWCSGTFHLYFHTLDILRFIGVDVEP